MEDGVFEDYSTQRVYMTVEGDAAVDGSETESDEPDSVCGQAPEVPGPCVITISDSESDDAVEVARAGPVRVPPHGPTSPTAGSNPFALMMASAAKLAASATPARKGGVASGTRRGSSFSKQQGPCPFYKRIPGTTFVVDCFQWSVPGCRHYFLSHFHSDHYGGLERGFADGTIFCSETTAALLLSEIKVSPSRVRSLPLYRPTLVDGVTVTLLDANHCPGAAMLLFEVPCSGGGVRRHLHVGDFRWIPRMAAFPALIERPPAAGASPLTSQPKRLDTLFLDTTFAHPSYDFPPQAAVRAPEAALLSIVRPFAADRGVLVLVGSYKIGKERVFMQLAEALNERVFVTPAKYRALSLLGWPPGTMARLTIDPTAARIHVVAMGALSLGLLTDRLRRLRAAADAGLATAAHAALSSRKRARPPAAAAAAAAGGQRSPARAPSAGVLQQPPRAAPPLAATLGLSAAEAAAVAAAQRAKAAAAAAPGARLGAPARLSLFSAAKFKARGGVRAVQGAYAAAMLRQSEGAAEAAAARTGGSEAASDILSTGAAADGEGGGCDDEDEALGGFIPAAGPAPQPTALPPPAAAGAAAAAAPARPPDINRALMEARDEQRAAASAAAAAAASRWGPFHSIIAIRPTGWAQQPGEGGGGGGGRRASSDDSATEVLDLLATIAGGGGAAAAAAVHAPGPSSFSRRDGAEDLRPGVLPMALAGGGAGSGDSAFSDAGQLRALAALQRESGARHEVSERRQAPAETRTVLLAADGEGAQAVSTAAAPAAAAAPSPQPGSAGEQIFKVRLTRQQRLGGARCDAAASGGGPLPPGGVTLLSAPYSEHSSFGELRQCVAWARPARIVPTANCRSREDAERLVGLLTAK